MTFLKIKLSISKQAKVSMKNGLTKIIAGMGILILFSNWARAQWVQTNGPEGGVINAIAVNEKYMFAGSDVFGVFRSTISNINSASWMAINNGLPQNVSFLSLKSMGNMIFLGTNANGMYKSADNGTSWKRIINGGLHQGASVGSIAASGGTIYAAVFGSGLFFSIDSGSSWSEIGSDNAFFDWISALEVGNVPI